MFILPFFNGRNSNGIFSFDESKIDFIEKVSAIVHETQKERGKTALFLNGGIEFSVLQTQQGVVNKHISELKSSYKNSGYDSITLEFVTNTLNLLPKLRGDISNRLVSTGESLRQYTGIIAKLLKLESDLARGLPFPKVSKVLTSLRTLEDGKESGGKLRANMASTFASNKAINSTKLNQIINLKAGVNSNITASSLVLGDTEEVLRKRFIE